MGKDPLGHFSVGLAVISLKDRDAQQMPQDKAARSKGYMAKAELHRPPPPTGPTSQILSALALCCPAPADLGEGWSLSSHQVLLESVEQALALPPARTEAYHALLPHRVAALEHSPFHVCQVPSGTMILVSCRI